MVGTSPAAAGSGRIAGAIGRLPASMMREGLLDAFLHGFMLRIQRHLMELRLLVDPRAAGRGGLPLGVLFGSARCFGGCGHECRPAGNIRSDGAGVENADETSHDDTLSPARMFARAAPQRRRRCRPSKISENFLLVV